MRHNMQKIREINKSERLRIFDYLKKYQTPGKQQIEKYFHLVLRDYRRYHSFVDNREYLLRPSANVKACKSAFKAAYDSAILAGELSTIRHYLTFHCHICGSERNGQLDHHLPSSRYPQFYVYGPNLIPVCTQCNPAKSSSGGYRHPFISGWLGTSYYQLKVINFSDGKPEFFVSLNRKISPDLRYKFSGFVRAAGIRIKILKYAEVFWFDKIFSEYTKSLAVITSAGLTDFGATVVNFSRHLHDKSNRLLAQQANSMEGLLLRAASGNSELLAYVVQQNTHKKTQRSTSYVLDRYGVY